MPLADATAYPLWVNGLIFACAAASLWLTAGRLTHALDRLALKTGLGHAFVGMLLLGGITSLPEVANVVTASTLGNPSLAINNLLGSSAINVLLLAIADACIGRRAVTSIVARPSTLMMAALCMIILILIAAMIVLGDIPAGPVALGSLAIGALCIGSFWLATGHDARSPWAVEDSGEGNCEEREEDHIVETKTRLWTLVALHGALVFLAGYALSQTGDAIAEQAGLTSAIVGFALIGTATSLPELVSILAALKLGRPEMAFGQVLGTNFINLSLLPLSDLLHDGEPVLNILGRFEIVSALLGALLIGIFKVGLLEHRDRTILRMGWDSAAVILIFGLGVSALARL